MNTTVLIFIVIQSTYCFEELDFFTVRKLKAYSTCMHKLKLSKDIAYILYSKRPPLNEDESCFLQCVYHQMGLIDENKINEDELLEYEKYIREKYGRRSIANQHSMLKECIRGLNLYEPQNYKKGKCYNGKFIRVCFNENM